MEKRNLYWIIGVLLILVIGMGVRLFFVSSSGHDMSMDDMVKGLEGKEGDAFDKAFIELMIPHHQGAVEMALLAREHAGHQELKDLAEAIIVAQNSEIAEMHAWYTAWGYGSHTH